MRHTIAEQIIVALARGDRECAQSLVDESATDGSRQSGPGLDIAAVQRIASVHRIGAIILRRLAELELPAAVKQEALGAARRAVVTAMTRSANLRREIGLLGKRLGDQGISFVLIKGPALDPDVLRDANDLDVLIEEDELQNVTAILEGDGYRYEGSGVLSDREFHDRTLQMRWNNQFQFRSPHTGVSVEVHINLFERDRIRLENLNALLDNVHVFRAGRVWDEQLGCSIPRREASLALLCVHSATKRSPAHNTYVLRQAYDIVSILRRGVDTAAFVDLCRLCEIEYYAVVSLRLAAIALQSQDAEALAVLLEPHLSRRRANLAEVHIACYRGLGAASVARRLHFALLMPTAIGDGPAKAARWYLSLLFPAVWSQEKRFGVRRSSPLIALTYLAGPFARIYAALVTHRRQRGSGSP